MKKISMILLFACFLPLTLIALERVNLIKNNSFEREDEYWVAYTGKRSFPVGLDSAQANAHDPDRAYTGLFSGSTDTHRRPGDDVIPAMFFDSAVVIQGFEISKQVNDLDSLVWRMKPIPRNLDYTRICMFGVTLEFDLGQALWKWCIYSFHGPSVNPGIDASNRKILNFEAPDDTNWLEYGQHVFTDWEPKGVMATSILDSIAVVSYGGYDWLGQKVYWDDIQLMGYADYDVGVKAILSGESDSPYIPTAWFKNFGREPADFHVIAEILDDETRIYYDSMPWSLPADADDTVSFLTFDPPENKVYTLRIRTFMDPDESDADDELSKELDFTAIVEPATPVELIDLRVYPLSTGDIHVSFSLPQANSGTLVIYDLSGKRIESKSIRGYGSVTFTSELSAGVYLVRLESEGFMATRKVVKVKLSN